MLATNFQSKRITRKMTECQFFNNTLHYLNVHCYIATLGIAIRFLPIEGIVKKKAVLICYQVTPTLFGLLNAKIWHRTICRYAFCLWGGWTIL